MLGFSKVVAICDYECTSESNTIGVFSCRIELALRGEPLMISDLFNLVGFYLLTASQKNNIQYWSRRILEI